jgi:hypothetical protein
MLVLFSPMEQYEIFPIISLNIIVPHTIGYLFVAGILSVILTYIGSGGKIQQGN